MKVVVCPAFADSISEGDLRWEKGKLITWVIVVSHLLVTMVKKDWVGGAFAPFASIFNDISQIYVFY